MIVSETYKGNDMKRKITPTRHISKKDKSQFFKRKIICN